MGYVERVLQRRNSEERAARAAREQRPSFQHTERKYEDFPDMYLTEEQHGALSGAVGGFNKEYNDKMKELAKAKGQIAKEAGSIDSKWDDFSKNFVKVNVVDGSKDWAIEGSYFLPRTMVDQLNEKSFNKEGSYVGNYSKDGSYNVDVVLPTSGEKYGKELHEALNGAQDQVKESWYGVNAKSLKELTDKYKNDLSEAEAALGMQKKQTEEEVGSIATAQKESMERVERSMLGFKPKSKEEMMRGM